MSVFDKKIEKKIEDLVGSVEYLTDQNITLMKRLDQTKQTLEEKILMLGMYLLPNIVLNL